MPPSFEPRVPLGQRRTGGARGRVRVVVADDHPLTRDGLVRALRGDGRFEVLDEVADGRQAVQAVQERQPELAVLDVRMPVLNGMRAMETIHDTVPDVRVVLLSAFEDPAVIRMALELGAAGYLTKGTDRLVLCEALARAAAGETVLPDLRTVPGPPPPPDLSARDRAILNLDHEGCSEEMIGLLVGLDATEVARALDEVVKRFQVADRLAAYRAACALGLLSPY